MKLALKVLFICVIVLFGRSAAGAQEKPDWRQEIVADPANSYDVVWQTILFNFAKDEIIVSHKKSGGAEIRIYKMDQPPSRKDRHGLTNAIMIDEGGNEISFRSSELVCSWADYGACTEIGLSTERLSDDPEIRKWLCGKPLQAPSVHNYCQKMPAQASK